eukprot:TRINITY_DN3115_c4_g1_i1.p1 TRINITY_DN3115_c4_g1~~TRINITY_DN3115_c4_g1_i1.p1  ORF type:complete len:2235 (+),score=659.51 TRINITY_DN3115_c4_g1_i1:137-6841(+)
MAAGSEAVLGSGWPEAGSSLGLQSRLVAQDAEMTASPLPPGREDGARRTHSPLQSWMQADQLLQQSLRSRPISPVDQHRSQPRSPLQARLKAPPGWFDTLQEPSTLSASSSSEAWRRLEAGAVSGAEADEARPLTLTTGAWSPGSGLGLSLASDAVSPAASPSHELARKLAVAEKAARQRDEQLQSALAQVSEPLHGYETDAQRCARLQKQLAAEIRSREHVEARAAALEAERDSLWERLAAEEARRLQAEAQAAAIEREWDAGRARLATERLRRQEAEEKTDVTAEMMLKVESLEEQLAAARHAAEQQQVEFAAERVENEGRLLAIEAKLASEELRREVTEERHEALRLQAAEIQEESSSKVPQEMVAQLEEELVMARQVAEQRGMELVMVQGQQETIEKLEAEVMQLRQIADQRRQEILKEQASRDDLVKRLQEELMEARRHAEEKHVELAAHKDDQAAMSQAAQEREAVLTAHAQSKEEELLGKQTALEQSLRSVRALREELDTAREQVQNHIQERHTELHAERQNASATLRMLEDREADLAQRVVLLEKEVTKQNAAVDAAARSTISMQSDLANARQQVHVEAQRYVALEQQLQRTMEELGQKEVTLGTALQTAGLLKEELSIAADKVAQHGHLEAQLQCVIDTATQEVEAGRRDCQVFRGRLEAEESWREAEGTQVRKLENLLAEKEASLQEAMDVSMEVQLLEANELQLRLAPLLEQTEQDIRALRDEMVSSQGALRLEKHMHQQEAAENQQLRTRLTHEHSEMDKARQAAAEVRTLKEELALRGQMVSLQEDDVAALRQQLTVKEQQLEAAFRQQTLQYQNYLLQDQVQSLQEELITPRRQHELTLLQELDDAKGAALEHTNKVEGLNQDCLDLRSKLLSSENLCHSEAAELQRLREIMRLAQQEQASLRQAQGQMQILGEELKSRAQAAAAEEATAATAKDALHLDQQILHQRNAELREEVYALQEQLQSRETMLQSTQWPPPIPASPVGAQTYMAQQLQKQVFDLVQELEGVKHVGRQKEEHVRALQEELLRADQERQDARAWVLGGGQPAGTSAVTQELQLALQAAEDKTNEAAMLRQELMEARSSSGRVRADVEVSPEGDPRSPSQTPGERSSCFPFLSGLVSPVTAIPAQERSGGVSPGRQPPLTPSQQLVPASQSPQTLAAVLARPDRDALRHFMGEQMHVAELTAKCAEDSQGLARSEARRAHEEKMVVDEVRQQLYSEARALMEERDKVEQLVATCAKHQKKEEMLEQVYVHKAEALTLEMRAQKATLMAELAAEEGKVARLTQESGSELQAAMRAEPLRPEAHALLQRLAVTTEASRQAMEKDIQAQVRVVLNALTPRQSPAPSRSPSSTRSGAITPRTPLVVTPRSRVPHEAAASQQEARQSPLRQTHSAQEEPANQGAYPYPFSRGLSSPAQQQQQQQQHQLPLIQEVTLEQQKTALHGIKKLSLPGRQEEEPPSKLDTGNATSIEKDDGKSLPADSDGESEGEPPPPCREPSRRGAVSAEEAAKTNGSSAWLPPVYPKTEDEKEQLHNLLTSASSTHDSKLSMLFGTVSKATMGKIIDAMFSRKVLAGENVIEQGAVGDFFYVVRSGTFDVFVSKDGSSPAKVFQGGPGFAFGELALMYNAPRNATVTASVDSSVWCLERMSFQQLVVESSKMAYNELLEFIEGVEVFKVLSAAEKAGLADALEEEEFQNDEAILEQGETDDKMFIVREGKAVACIAGDQGEIEVMQYAKGSYFGEIALLLGEPRKASVYAVGACTCLYISRAAFARKLGPLKDKLSRNMSMYAKYQDAVKQAASSTDDVASAGTSKVVNRKRRSHQQFAPPAEDDETTPQMRSLKSGAQFASTLSEKITEDFRNPRLVQPDENLRLAESSVSLFGGIAFGQSFRDNQKVNCTGSLVADVVDGEHNFVWFEESKLLKTISTAVLCQKGQKPDGTPNQDNYFVCHLRGVQMYGVIDGHGPFGHLVSFRLAQSLPKLLSESPHFGVNWKVALKEAFQGCQDDLVAFAKAQSVNIEASGAAAAILVSQDQTLHIAHLGDCRVMVGSWNRRDGRLIFSTRDHKPELPEEKSRLENAGSEVREVDPGAYRIFLPGTNLPGLTMSRAFGDTMLPGVSREPDYMKFSIGADDEWYAIVASDGIWEFIDGDTAWELTSKKMRLKGAKQTLQHLVSCSRKRWHAVSADYCDDITAVVVQWNSSDHKDDQEMNHLLTVPDAGPST